MRDKASREISMNQDVKKKYLTQLQQHRSDKNKLRLLLLSSSAQTTEAGSGSRSSILARLIHSIFSLCSDSYNITWIRQHNGSSPRAAGIFSSKNTNCPLRILSKSLIEEIEKINKEDGHLVSSALLHSTPQLYQKEALQVELNRNLTAVISDIIRNEERAHSIYIDHSIPVSGHDSCSGTFDSEEDEQITHDSLLSANSDLVITGNNDTTAQYNYCNACNSETCQWKSSIKYLHKVKYRESLTRDMLLNRKQSCPNLNEDETVLLGLNSDGGYFVQEAALIDDECKLYNIDMELHNAYNKTHEKYIVIHSLHSYEIMMNTNHAIIALEKEQERLVAKVTAIEIIHEILEW
jgi:hypothetical protein